MYFQRRDVGFILQTFSANITQIRNWDYAEKKKQTQKSLITPHDALVTPSGGQEVFSLALVTAHSTPQVLTVKLRGLSFFPNVSKWAKETQNVN